MAPRIATILTALCLIGASILASAAQSVNQAPVSTGAATDTTPPRATHEVRALYPDGPKRAGIRGTVLVGLIVQRDGLPTDVHVVRSLHKVLDAQAVKAVQQWRFAPATRSGQAVAMATTVEIFFGVEPPAPIVDATTMCQLGGGPPAAPFSIRMTGDGPVAVVIRDGRDDIVHGKSKETLVGHQRSLYGVPYPEHTTSGRTLAQELAAIVAAGFERGGVSVRVFTVSPLTSKGEAIAALGSADADRRLLFNIMEWNADTYARTTLYYGIDLTVLNRSGKVVGESSLAGEDDIRKDLRPERQSVCAAVENLIQTLITTAGHPQKVAPTAPAAQPAAPTPGALTTPMNRCTVDQILKMKDAGLTQQQIEAACSGLK